MIGIALTQRQRVFGVEDPDLLAVGSAQRALDESVAFAAATTQGGEPIGGFQLVQAMIADQ